MTVHVNPMGLGRRAPWSSRRQPEQRYLPPGRQECVLLGGPYDGRKVILSDSCRKLDVHPLQDYHDGPDVYLRFGNMLICQLKVNKRAGE